MFNLKSIIVDDEESARNTLKSLIEKFCEGVDVLGEARSVDQAVEMIYRHKPDIIFLDVNMPGKSGFELFDMIPALPCDVIFTTAYEEFALKAIKSNALDYLVKPIDFGELQNAITKARKKKLNQNVPNKDSLQKLVIPTNEGFIVYAYDSIIYLQGDRNYTQIFHKEGKLTSSKTLRFFEDVLPADRFYRSHKSYIVNIDFIQKVNKREQTIELKNGESILLSREKVKDIGNHFG